RSEALARRAGLPTRQGEALIGLALTQVMGGRARAGLRTLARAEGLVSGSSAHHLLLQRALVLTRMGRFDEAVVEHGRALAGMRADGDREGESRVLNNRGILPC